MASALVNNVGVTPEAFMDCCPPTASYSSFGWLSPRISFSRDEDKPSVTAMAGAGSPSKASSKGAGEEKKVSDLESPGKDSSVFDFEFRLDDPVTMLPADELFLDGKLVPLHLSSARPQSDPVPVQTVRLSPVVQKTKRMEISGSTLDPYVFSPKAPRCSSRWRELLGLKKAAAADAQQNSSTKPDQNHHQNQKITSSAATTKSPTNTRGLRHFLQRNHNKLSMSESLNLPLLRDSESESVSISARLSLSSSSSSGPDHEDLPRLSLDNDKPCQQNPILLNRNPPRQLRVAKPRSAGPLPDHPAVRVGRSQVRRAPEVTIPPRGASVDSPRMNSYGKIVFQSLERSSSSPSTFNGGPRAKQRGMERSYSANVRVTPVLNVPVCSLRGSSKAVFGLGQLFSPQKKETGVRSNGSASSRSRVEKA